MTAINIASSIIYTRGAPLREKIQTFALAGIFLFLLYNSPSGLVFYWVLNQIFSLCKNIVNKTKSPNRIWHIVLSVILVFVSEYVFLYRPGSNKYTRLFLYAFTLVFCALPLIKKCWINWKILFERFRNLSKSEWFALKSIFVFACLLLIALNGYYCVLKPDVSVKKKFVLNIFTILFVMIPLYYRWFGMRCLKISGVVKPLPSSQKDSFTLLLLSCVSLCLFCGLLLPSSVIATSPAEFSFLGSTDSPLSYVWSSLAFFAGLFVFWPLVIYKMFGDNKTVKAIMPPLFFVLAMCSLANAFLFNHNYGTLSLSFTFNEENTFVNKPFLFFIAPTVFFLLVVCVYICFQKKLRILVTAIVVLLMAQFFIFFGKIKTINSDYKEFVVRRKETTFSVLDENGNIIPQFHLSKKKKNVVVMFWDRAISAFFPYILEEFPELKKDFEGFVCYPNCISFGGHTITGSSAMFGGYEYSPSAMNERADVLLKDKHNEALLLMPKLFSDAGFNVTVADLPFTNYEMYFDSKFYERIPNVKAIEIENKLGDKYLKECARELVSNSAEICDSKIKKFSLLEILFPLFRKVFYNYGKYYSCTELKNAKYPKALIDTYAELFYLTDLTGLDSEKNSFTIFENMLTHYDSVFTMVGKDYHPGIDVLDSSEEKTGFYNPVSSGERTSYQVNAAAYLLLARWIRFLKENGCYDNTRIIVVSDHGFFEDYKPFREFSTEWPDNKGFFNPLFMVKDFDSNGEPFIDNTFTTNAETLNFAIKDLPISNINPFTYKQFQHAEDFSSFTIIDIKEGTNPVKWNPVWWKDKTQFIDRDYLWSFSVHDNIFDESNWKKLDTSEVEK